MSSLISIGLSGIKASQTAIATTGNNITNADTEGYSRQSTQQTASASEAMGNSFVGTGTTVSDVRRSYSQTLTTQVQNYTARDSEASTYSSSVAQVDSLLSDSTTGISTSLSDYFTAVQNASATPEDATLRSQVLSKADALSDRYNSLDAQLSEQNSYVNTQLSASAEQVNTLTQQISDYNTAIQQASSSGATPNSLLDARDQSVTELSKLVGVTVVNQNGNYNVYLGSGQPLIVGDSVSTLGTRSSAEDPSQSAVILTMPSGSDMDVTSSISGGSMTGLVRYREDVLDPTRNGLGRLALSTADSVNSLQAQGVDLDGELGSGLFADVNSASAQASRSIGRSSNSDSSANLNVAIADSSTLTTSDYKVVFTSDSNYSVRRLADGKDLGSFSLADDPPATFDGLQVSRNSGSFAQGDTFTLQPTRQGAAQIQTDMLDTDDLAFAAPLKTSSASGNLGSGQLSAPTLTSEVGGATSDYTTSLKNALPVKVQFGQAASDGTQSYTLYDASGNSLGSGSSLAGQSNTFKVSIAANGTTVPKAFDFEVTVGGTPAAGDTFTIAYNADGASDNTNALALAGLQTKSVLGNQSLTDAASTLTQNVGSQASQASSAATTSSSLLEQANNSLSSVAGVDLDEEAANLVEYQNYYNAASKVIQVAQEMFDTLIQSL